MAKIVPKALEILSKQEQGTKRLMLMWEHMAEIRWRYLQTMLPFSTRPSESGASLYQAHSHWRFMAMPDGREWPSLALCMKGGARNKSMYVRHPICVVNFRLASLIRPGVTQWTSPVWAHVLEGFPVTAARLPQDEPFPKEPDCCRAVSWKM